jgi:cytochrome c oxidase subunit 2
MALAVVLILLVIGTVVFHFLSPWYFTPLASNWNTIDHTVNITFWVTGLVFIAVNLFLAYVVVRYRHRSQGSPAHYEPESKKLEGWLTGLTAVGVAAMLAPGLVVWGHFVTVPDDADQMEAVGAQWNWKFRFPGEDGVLGTTDVRRMSVENPFGINPDDPHGQDDILVSSAEVHLPIDRPVKLVLRSQDVLHDFAVPQFRMKMDLVPGMVTYAWLTPTRTGRFDILCEELCGIAHFAMRGRVIVDQPDDFRTWLASQPTYADTANRPPGDATAGAAMYTVCSACHGAQGEGNPTLHAPKLAGQPAWYLKRQIRHFQDGLRGADEQDTYGRQMAPMAQTLASEQAIDNVLAYIETLPDEPAAQTVSGDVPRGARLYATCGACHGPQAQGTWTVGAPRLAGMSDWYLVTQLQNFRHDIRGSNEEDFYGNQMASMTSFLTDDAIVNDLVAYINTL